MKKFIHHIRRQPEGVRRHILHVITVAFAIILFLLWVVSLSRSFTKEENRAAVRENLAPFSALKANLVGGYQSITE